MSGSFHTEAWRRVSWKVPLAEVASPKAAMATWSVPLASMPMAAPPAMTKQLPRVPPSPSSPIVGVGPLGRTGPLATGRTGDTTEDVTNDRFELHALAQGPRGSTEVVGEEVVASQGRGSPDGGGLVALAGVPVAVEPVVLGVLADHAVDRSRTCHVAQHAAQRVWVWGGHRDSLRGFDAVRTRGRAYGSDVRNVSPYGGNYQLFGLTDSSR